MLKLQLGEQKRDIGLGNWEAKPLTEGTKVSEHKAWSVP